MKVETSSRTCIASREGDVMSRIRLLSRSWSEAAAGYQKEIVPRFMPWTLHALQSLKACGLPPGLILVPACGPGECRAPVGAWVSSAG